VYLLIKNLKIKRPSQKLNHKKVGLFRIKRVKGLVNFELDLPKGTRIHLVFYISLLKPVDA
jgi:ribosomal protein L11